MTEAGRAERPGNPDALPGAAPPRVHRCRANGTTLHVEVRGSGPALLLVHSGGEDAEVWRGVAERLPDFTVVTYDRRGTLRSGRDDWPGRGSAQHVDDAAAMLEALGLDGVTVVASSSAGVIAVRLALEHPRLVPRAVAFEPGLFGHVRGGEDVRRPVVRAVEDHLAGHPGDWSGAALAFRGAVDTSVDGGDGLLAAPAGLEWYAARELLDAEAMVRDDLPILTGEVVDERRLATSAADIRFSYGTASAPVFRRIATHLAAVRGADPVAVDGAGHLLYYDPDAAAAHIRDQAGHGRSHEADR